MQISFINPVDDAASNGNPVKEEKFLTRDSSNKTNEESGLYRFPLWEEVSTATPAWEYEMSKTFLNIYQTCSQEETEDESSPFIKELRGWVENYGVLAVQVLIVFMNSTSSNKELNSQILELLGDTQNQTSYSERLSILKHALSSSMPELKYGAVLGLANLGSQETVTDLEHALEKEKTRGIANVIKRVIILLKEDKK